ncbi:MAG: ABC transporter substrate-binding protein [Bacillota bacterium]
MKKAAVLQWSFLVASLLLLPGCRRQPKLSFMVGGASNEIAYLEELIAEFEAKHEIQVKLIRQSSDTEQRKQSLLVSLRGRSKDPDVMLVDVAWMGQFASSDWLEPLDSYAITTGPFFQNIIKMADTYSGKLIGVPLYVDAGLLYYRQDLLDKYGYQAPPRTWPELVRMAQIVQAGERPANPDFWGFVWQGAQYEGLICNALEYFVSTGGGFMDQDGQFTINNVNNVKALSLMNDLIHKNKISPPNTFTEMKEEEARTMFQNGNALFERNWPYAWSLHNAADSAIKGRVRIAVLPHFIGFPPAATLGGWHVVVSRFSDCKPKAVAFLKYLTSYEIQKKLPLKLGWNPGREDVYLDQDLKTAAPHLHRFKTVFIHAIPRPQVPYYSQLSQIMQKHFNAALAGKETPHEAIAKTDAEIKAVIAENGY